MNNKAKEKSIIVIKQKSILEKIKSFLRKILFDKTIQTVDKINIEEVKITDNFKKKIKYRENHKKIQLIKLQKLYEMGDIKDEDLKAEDFFWLKKLYTMQIEEIKKTLNKGRTQKRIIM